MTLRSNISVIAAIAGTFAAGLITGSYWFGPVRSNDAYSAATGGNSQLETLEPATRVLLTPKPSEPNTSPRSRFSGTLAQGPDAIKAALDSVATPDEMRQEMTKLFSEAAYVASTTGEFGLLANLFSSVSQTDRYLLGHQLPTVFSKLGPAHDIGEKLAILEHITVSKGQLEEVRRQIYQMEALERYEEMKKEGVVGNLSTIDFVDICRALGRVRIGKAFERVADGGDEVTQRAAASALGAYAMQSGTLDGSREITKLPPGIIRDEAVAELVAWLRKTGSKEEAQPWLDTITDEQAKKRATQ